jgi:drug/metabolite transporter (DMT)-like permease
MIGRDNTRMSIRIAAYINLTLAMMISGSAVVVSKMMTSSLPTFLATELGIMIGMLILLPMTLFIKKESFHIGFKTHVILFAQAFCGVFLYRICTYIGLHYTSAATSGLITSASPLLVLLFAFFILREKINRFQVIAIICSVSGLVILNLYTYISAAEKHESMFGNLLILAAVICEALFSILSKVKSKPVSALCRTTVIVCYAFLLLLPFSIHDALRYDFHKMNLQTILCITYYGVFVTFLSYIFWFRGIAKVPAGNAAVFTSVVPITSILLLPYC